MPPDIGMDKITSTSKSSPSIVASTCQAPYLWPVTGRRHAAAEPVTSRDIRRGRAAEGQRRGPKARADTHTRTHAHTHSGCQPRLHARRVLCHLQQVGNRAAVPAAAGKPAERAGGWLLAKRRRWEGGGGGCGPGRRGVLIAGGRGASGRAPTLAMPGLEQLVAGANYLSERAVLWPVSLPSTPPPYPRALSSLVLRKLEREAESQSEAQLAGTRTDFRNLSGRRL